MGFREQLESLVQDVDGAVAASVMGFDGIAIDTVEVEEEGQDLDIQTLLIEYSNIINQLRQATHLLQSGAVKELSVNTEKLVTICRPLPDDYFMVIAISPDANYGKARYLLRLAVPKILAEF